MSNNTYDIKDIKIFAIHSLINEGKSPMEISSILGVPAVVIIGWLKNYSDGSPTALKIQINQLQNEILNLKGETYL